MTPSFMTSVEQWDRVATLALNGWAGVPPPRAWVMLWWAWGLLGTGVVALPLLWLVLLERRDRDLLRRRVGLCVAGMLVPLAVVYTLKPLVNRARPAASVAGVWAVDPLRARSFPSGHAAAAGAAVAVAATLSRRRRGLVIAVATPMAFGVAFSRVALGAHFLADVVAGLVIGVGAALAVMTPLARRLGLSTQEGDS